MTLFMVQSPPLRLQLACGHHVPSLGTFFLLPSRAKRRQSATRGFSCRIMAAQPQLNSSGAVRRARQRAGRLGRYRACQQDDSPAYFHADIRQAVDDMIAKSAIEHGFIRRLEDARGPQLRTRGPPSHRLSCVWPRRQGTHALPHRTSPAMARLHSG
jgi:hypothetical protein